MFRRYNETSSGSGKGIKSRVIGLRPILFILDPSEEKKPDFTRQISDLEDASADFIRLWIMNYIQNTYVKESNDKEPRLFKTDFEGCLVFFEMTEIAKENEWADLAHKSKGRINEYSFFFSTISLEGLDVAAIFSKYAIPGASSSSSAKGIQLDKAKLKILRPYEPIYVGGPIQDLGFANYHVVKIPLGSLRDMNILETLEYWESIIFYHSESQKIKSVRQSCQMNQASPAIFKNVKSVIKTVRGKHVAGLKATVFTVSGVTILNGDPGYIDEQGKPDAPEDLPFMVYDRFQAFELARPQHRLIFWEKRFDSRSLQGPYWLESDYLNTDEAPGSQNTFKMKKTIHLYLMNEAEANEGKLPFSGQGDSLPSVRDSAFFEIFDTSELVVPFTSAKYSERDLGKSLSYILGRNKRDASIRDHLYVGHGSSWNECLLEALNAAALRWKYRTRSSFEDVSKSGGLTDSLVIPTHVKISFDTMSDAFSESLAPLHVYSQIKSWWDGLSDYDKFNILNCSYVTVQGHTSKAGDEVINKPLRENRAWKTARALWLLLEGEFKKDPWKKELLEPEKKACPLASRFDRYTVPIYYWGESANPHHLLLVPHGNIRVQVTPDDKIIEESVKNHFREHPDDDPNHRVAILTFHQIIPPYVEQMVRSEIRLVTATPIPSYRVLVFHEQAGLPERRMLVYIPVPRWL